MQEVRFYVPGRWAAKTPEDDAEMAAAAIECWVFRMRRAGQRLVPGRVGEPSQGRLLVIDRYGEPDRFYVRLYPPDSWRDWVDELHGASLVRSGGGVWLFRGDEWIAAEKRHYLQTWLCTARPERGWEILQQMGGGAGEVS
jgi:hypothetical protein